MVSIKFTYDYDSALLPIYRELYESEFTGRDWIDRIDYIPDYVLEYKLKSTLLARRLDKDQMEIMVIYYEDKPVGLSFPRNIFTDEEKEAFQVEDFEYYKIGSIIILKEYRNKGIAYSACKLFLDKYKPIVYHVDIKNESSIRLAHKLGLTYSHTTRMNSVEYLVFK